MQTHTHAVDYSTCNYPVLRKSKNTQIFTSYEQFSKPLRPKLRAKTCF